MEALHALVRGDGDGRGQAIEPGFLTNGKRLFDKGDSCLDQHREHLLEDCASEALIGIYTEPYAGHGVPNSAHAWSASRVIPAAA